MNERNRDFPSFFKGLDPDSKKTLFEDFGEMLFTHYGVSGPIILSASAFVRDISGKVFLTLFFRVFVPFLSLADFVSRDKNLQVADLQWLKLYLGGLITTTTSNHQNGL